MSSLFTSEAVCAGHPDKICDQISDAILDAALAGDSRARVAVETLVTTNQVVLAGEVTTTTPINYEQVARRVIRKLGYTQPAWGFSDRSEVRVLLHEQSADIALGVDEGGAGDQGLMFGYACRQTPEFMPVPIAVANALAAQLDMIKARFSFLRPDGKTQLTFRYLGRTPKRVEKVVVAVPHDPAVSLAEVRETVIREAIGPVLEHYGFAVATDRVVINGTGTWEIGGPASDTGVTGRKIIVDTYGGWAPHGGGCFSGKDATKVDRSAAYAARWVAKNVVAAGLASECQIQVAYVIGKAAPVSVRIETFGTETRSVRFIERFIAQHLTDFRVGDILAKLDLRKPQYETVAAYGHFGRANMPWEAVVV